MKNKDGHLTSTEFARLVAELEQLGKQGKHGLGLKLIVGEAGRITQSSIIDISSSDVLPTYQEKKD